LGDPATLAYALDGHQGAILWPETPLERLEIADEIVALAEQVGDDERATSGRLYRLLATMELGRMAEAEAELELMGEQATALRQPAQLWVATASRANLALFQGRFEEAEQLIEEALALGQRAQSRDAILSHRLQLFVLNREIGGNPDMELLLREAAAEFPMRPVFRCALAYLYAELGDLGRSQAAIDELAPDGFAAIQRDNEYLFALGFLADAVHTLGDERTAAILYELLAPYAHLNAINADEIGTGSVSRPLGVLATTMRAWDDAAQKFEMAMAHNREWGARPWVAHSEHGYGRMLQLGDAPADRDRARHLLSSALEKYERLAMAPWLARAAEALAAV
jgi:tetratricopeptide (TPR) repeat protein